jgi:hypothetical protein
MAVETSPVTRCTGRASASRSGTSRTSTWAPLNSPHSSTGRASRRAGSTAVALAPADPSPAPLRSPGGRGTRADLEAPAGPRRPRRNDRRRAGAVHEPRAGEGLPRPGLGSRPPDARLARAAVGERRGAGDSGRRPQSCRAPCGVGRCVSVLGCRMTSTPITAAPTWPPPVPPSGGEDRAVVGAGRSR